jgi:hypothetical protein
VGMPTIPFCKSITTRAEMLSSWVRGISVVLARRDQLESPSAA